MSDEATAKRELQELRVDTEARENSETFAPPRRDTTNENDGVEPAPLRDHPTLDATKLDAQDTKRNDMPPKVARGAEQPMPLFSTNDSQALRTRWENLQVSFIDEPKHAVEEADRLVSDTIHSLSQHFATEREKLEQQWHRGEDASTEDLRLALRRYRSFFERLLSI